MKKTLLTLVLFIAFGSIAVSQCLDDSFVITGDSEVCAGTTTNYMIPFEENVTYQWRVVPQGFQFQDNYGGTISFTQNNAEIVWNELDPSFGDPLIIATRTIDNCEGNGPETISITRPINHSNNSPDYYTNEIIGARSLCGLESRAYLFTNTKDLDINLLISSGGEITSSTPSGNDKRFYISWNEIGSHMVNVEYSNSCGDSRYDSFSVDVYEDFDTPTISGSTEVCYGETYTFTTPYEEGVEYNWFGLGISSTSTSNVAEVNITGTYETSYVRVTASRNGCSKTSDYLYINVNQNRLTNIGGDYPSCYELNTPYTYTVNQGLGSSYIWTLSDGGNIESDGNSATIVWNEYGTHTITVVENTICGVKSTSREVVVGLQNSNSITGDPTPCIDQETYLRIYKSGSFNTENYNWNLLGDGAIISTTNNTSYTEVRIIWNSVGSKQVNCEITNSCGESIVKSFNQSVIENPVPDLPITVTGNQLLCTYYNYTHYAYEILDENVYDEIFKYYYVVLKDSNLNVIASQYNSGKNGSLYVKDKLNTAGIYTIEVFIKYKCGLSSNSYAALDIELFDKLPNYELSGNCITVVGEPTEFSIPFYEDVVYNWSVKRQVGSVDDLIIDSSLNNYTITWGTPGIYFIDTSITNAGCSSTSSRDYIVVLDESESDEVDKIGIAPDLPIIQGPSQKCYGINDIYQIANPEPGLKYDYELIDSNNLVIKSGSFYYAGPYTGGIGINEIPGIYTLKVVAERCGLFSVEGSYDLEILNVGKPEVPQIVGPSIDCLNSTSVFTIENSQPELNYTWSFVNAPDATYSNINANTIEVTWNSAIYNNDYAKISVTATNGFCETSGNKSVIVNDYPLEITVPNVICRNIPATLSISNNYYSDEIIWELDGGTFESEPTDYTRPRIIWETAGIKTVRVILTKNGCSYENSTIVTIDNATRPDPLQGPEFVNIGEKYSYAISSPSLPSGLSYVGWGTGNSLDNIESPTSRTTEITWGQTGYRTLSVYTNYCNAQYFPKKYVNVMDCGAEPTLTSSNLTFESTDNSIYLEWTPGNGSNRIVIAKEANYVFWINRPLDAYEYTADSNYGDGEEMTLNGFSPAYVVYNGPGSSCTVNNLNPSTTYHFMIYEYNNENCTNYWTQNTDGYLGMLSGSYDTKCNVLDIDPTQSSTLESIDNSVDNQISLSWLNGDGDNHVVIVRKDNPISHLPIDGLDYRASNIFGEGQDLGNGNYVVYNGSESNITINNLDKLSHYYFAIVEGNFNECYGGNYLLTDIPNGDFETRCNLPDEPITQISSFESSNVNSNSARLSWTNDNVGTNNVLIIATTNVTVTSIPLNGLDYTANTNFGDGHSFGNGDFVVFKGPVNSFTMNNLNELTNYTLALYTYNANSSCSTTINYSDESIETFFITDCITPTPVSGTSGSFNFTDVRDTRMNIIFPTGTGDKRIVVAKAGGSVSAEPADGNINYSPTNNSLNGGYSLGGGNYVIYNGSGNSTTLTGLNPSTDYHFEVFEYNENTDCSVARVYDTDSNIINNIETSCAPPTTPSNGSDNLSFSNITNTQMKLTWDNGNGNLRMVVAKQGQAVDLDPNDGAWYQHNTTFGASNEYGNGNYVVYKGGQNNVTIAGLDPSTNYHFAIFEYNQNTDCYVKRSYNTNNVERENQSTLCTQPNSPSAASNARESGPITDDILNFNWTNSNGDKRLVIARAGNPVSAVPADGQDYLANYQYGIGHNFGNGNYAVYNGSNNFCSISRLNPNTTYHIAVYEYNVDNGCYVNTIRYSSGSATASDQTMCANPQPSSPSGVSITNVTSSSMRVNWSNGNGNKRLVVARKNYAVNQAPDDNMSYGTSSTFGNGYNLGSGNYVIYSGTGSYCYIYGLDPGSKYYVKVYEYNFDDGCYPFTNYNPNSESKYAVTSTSSGGGGDPCLSAKIEYQDQKRSASSIEDQLIIIPDCNLSVIHGIDKKINIEFSSKTTAESEIHVYDMTGKKVKYLNNCVASETNVVMDFNDLPDYSILIVQVINAYESKSVKVMLTR